MPNIARGDCNDPFGKPEQLLDFHIRLKRTDWNALLASRVPSTDGNRAACEAKYPEFPAEFRCGTSEPWLPVALRKKRGEERGIEAPKKPPLKIDFNEDFMGTVPAAKGQRWPQTMGELGYRKLTLNNGQGNKAPGRTLMLPNLLSEHTALRLLRREVPSTPGTAFAKVTLYFEDLPAGEYHGTYLLVEDIDRTALVRRWGRGDGRLVKASKAGCPLEVQHDDGPPNAAKAAYDAWIGRGAGSLEQAQAGVEVESTLRQEAIREILVNGDDTLFFAGGDGNNWYSYDPREGVRQYMPWDVDLTFGQQQQNCAPNSLKCPATFPILTWCTRNVSRIGRALACNPQIQKRYLEIMCQLTNGSLSAGEILKLWESADATARPGVALEKGVIWPGDPLDTGADKSYGAEFVRLKQWIPERIRSVQQQINAKGVTCMPGCPAGASEACRYLGCPGERRCENDLWSVCRPTGACAAANPPPSNPPAAADGGVGGDASPTGGGGGSGGGAPGTGGSGGSGGQGPSPGQPPSGGSSGAGGAGGGAGGGGGGGGGAGRPDPRPGQPPAGSAPTNAPGGGCQYAGGAAPRALLPLAVLLAAALIACVSRRSRRTHSS